MQGLCHTASEGMVYKWKLASTMPVTALNATGNVHSPSASRATSSQYHQLPSGTGQELEQPGARVQICKAAVNQQGTGEGGQTLYSMQGE